MATPKIAKPFHWQTWPNFVCHLINGNSTDTSSHRSNYRMYCIHIFSIKFLSRVSLNNSTDFLSQNITKHHQHGINQTTQLWFATANKGKYDKWQQSRWNRKSRMSASSTSFQWIKNLHTLGINSDIIISTFKGCKCFLYMPC